MIRGLSCYINLVPSDLSSRFDELKRQRQKTEEQIQKREEQIQRMPMRNGGSSDYATLNNTEAANNGTAPKKEKLVRIYSEAEKKEPTLWETTKAAAKGVISPVTNMFSSWGNFAKGVGSIAATGLILGTAALAAPAVAATVGIGVAAIGGIIGGYRIYNGWNDLKNAKTHDEKLDATKKIGSGTGTVALGYFLPRLFGLYK